jgi:hypothetical protein
VPPRTDTGHIASEKICPKCNSKLPRTAGEQTDLIIGLVGAVAAGKSHYIATLVRRLGEDLYGPFGAALSGLTDETTHRYRVEFQEPLYEMGQEVRKTGSNPPPLLYELSFEGKHVRRVTLSLYDADGSDFNAMDSVVDYASYLRLAAGVLLLIDPLQIPIVRQLVAGKAKLPKLDSRVDPAVIIGNLIGFLANNQLLNNHGKFDTPVAVVLTKCDALLDAGLIKPHTTWANFDRRHQDYYDLAMHEGMSGMFEELVQTWSPGAYSQIKVNFSRHAFFGVSATGCSSDEKLHFPLIAPRRVEDPLLWLLQEMRVIRSGRP